MQWTEDKQNMSVYDIVVRRAETTLTSIFLHDSLSTILLHVSLSSVPSFPGISQYQQCCQHARTESVLRLIRYETIRKHFNAH